MAGVTVTPYFTPTQISNCLIWFDAADSTKFSLTGITVNSWTSKGSYTGNAAANTGTVVSGTVTQNGVNVVRFAAGTQLAFTMAVPNQARAWFSVTRCTTQISQATSPSFWSIIGASSSGAGEEAITGAVYGVPATNSYFVDLLQPGIADIVRANNIADSYQIWTIISYVNSAVSTGSNIITINGTSQTLGTSSLASGYRTSSYTKIINQANLNSGMDVGEIIMYNGEITTVQRQSVESYLAQKWGLASSLPAGHPGINSIVYRSLIPAPVRVTPYASVSYTFAPTQISNCQLWLDSYDPLGTGTAPSYGATFTTLADKSGNSRNFSVYSGSTYYCNYESRPSIFISNSIMYASNAVNLTSYTIFIVCQSSNYADNQTTFVALTNSNGASDYNSYDSFGFYVDAATNRNRFYGSINTNVVYNSLTAVGANYYPLSQTCYSSTSGGSLLSYANGNVGGSQNAGITRTGTATGFAIGADYASGVLYTTNPKVFINEIIVYNFVLSDIQRRQVEAYLSQKWALTTFLPGGHTALTVPYYVNQSFIQRAARTIPVAAVKTTGSATGGTVSTANGYRTHSFTTVGSTNFIVTGLLKVQVLVVGGGGAGASGYESGGGGAGGAVFNSGLLISAGTYSATVGNGGAGAVILPRGGQGASGTNSSFLTLTGNGGGGGGNYGDIGVGFSTRGTGGQAANGGCGGGGGGNGDSGVAGTAGSGNQGYGGGTSTNYGGSGGGGMGSAGSNATTAAGASGGLGLTYQVGNQSYLVCGGGGGGSELGAAGGSGGSGIGGNGGVGNNTPNGTAPTNGSVNTGGGGGGSYGYTSQSHAGGNGGSGIVIIAYVYP